MDIFIDREMNWATYKYIYSKIVSLFMIYNFFYIYIDMDIFMDREMNLGRYKYIFSKIVCDFDMNFAIWRTNFYTVKRKRHL